MRLHEISILHTHTSLKQFHSCSSSCPMTLTTLQKTSLNLLGPTVPISDSCRDITTVDNIVDATMPNKIITNSQTHTPLWSVHRLLYLRLHVPSYWKRNTHSITHSPIASKINSSTPPFLRQHYSPDTRSLGQSTPPYQRDQ